MKFIPWLAQWGWNMLLALALLLGIVALAPTVEAQAVANLYMAGLSYNAGGSPSVAGSGLFAHQIGASSTYAFTHVDALPSTARPFTVSTSFGVGVAQRVATVAGVAVMVPTAVALSYSGTNTGWAWSTGAGAPFQVRPNWYVMPTLRVLKSSIGGSGYQPIVGVLFGWGK